MPGKKGRVFALAAELDGWSQAGARSVAWRAALHWLKTRAGLARLAVARPWGWVALYRAARR
jgi:hypothetical protein